MTDHHISRRTFQLTLLTGALFPIPLLAQNNSSKVQQLITAARAQIGLTTIYDGSYQTLVYPNGDVPRERGVCTDVIIRAYRDAFKYDLQKMVHEDMQGKFSAYPKIWGMKKPDKNIDHRRVPNLQTFFKRKGAQLADNVNYQAGDIVTQMLPGNLPHILIVSDRKNPSTQTPLVIHNIGAGTQEEDRLNAYKITGHYRFFPV